MFGIVSGETVPARIFQNNIVDLKKKEKETNKQLNIDFIKQSLISKNKRFLSGFSIHINVSLIIHTG